MPFPINQGPGKKSASRLSGFIVRLIFVGQTSKCALGAGGSY
jgi:hypothetical protein